jgi:sirohydrochlorin ferrochelatase
LLGELILEERITVEGDRLRVLNRRPPADALAHTILDHLLAEGTDHPVRTWLVFLARSSMEQVADRLWRAGHIRREQSRRLWRSELIYPPTDANTAYWPVARLASKLGQGRQMTWPEATLCGLAVATGLDGHLLYTSDPTARDYLRHIIEHLTPALHALVWHLHAAVGDAVLTGRT